MKGKTMKGKTMKIETTATELIITGSSLCIDHTGNPADQEFYKIEFYNLIGELTEDEWFARLWRMGYGQDANEIMKALKNLPYHPNFNKKGMQQHPKVRLFDGIFWTNPDA